MGKLRPAGRIRPAGPFILAGDTYTNSNSHRELSKRPFFPLEIMDDNDFQQNKPQRCKIGMKNEVKTFYFGDHVRTWTVISKKRSSPCFSISVRSAASTVFPNLALRVESLPTPAVDRQVLILQHQFFLLANFVISILLQKTKGAKPKANPYSLIVVTFCETQNYCITICL